MRDDDDMVNEKALAVFVKSGPWALLAVVLVVFYLGKIDPAIETIQAEHREMRAEDADSDSAVKNVMGQVLMAIERSNYLERRNCMNTARTATDRDACLRDRD